MEKNALRYLSSTRINNLTIVFLLAAPFVVAYYGAFVFNIENADHTLLYGLQLLADSISILVLMGLWVTVLLDVIVEWHHRLERPWSKDFLATNPTIDVLIPTAGESLEVIEATVRAAIAMEYPHRTIVCDDGHSRQVRALAKRLGADYTTRLNRQHAKAGNLNLALQSCTGEFFAIIDADHIPEPDFIMTLLPFMVNPKVAMVQSPQFYTNTDRFIAAGAAQAQEVFYRYVCPSKNISNSAFCVGTNVIYRRKAIDEVGGVAKSKSEDIWTSYLLHEAGWHTIFVNKVLAKGQAPETVISYFKQQFRWARGGLEMLFHHNPLRSTKLHMDQKVQYAISNAFFLVGISITIYLLFPLLYLLFGVKPLQAEDPFTWLVHYAPFFLLYYSLTWLLTGKLHVSTLATAIATFFPYMKALYSVLFNKDQAWSVTNTRGASQDYFLRWTWPHIFVILLTPLSIIVGWYNAYDFWSTVFYTAWAVINAYLLYIFLTGEQRAGVMVSHNNV